MNVIKQDASMPARAVAFWLGAVNGGMARGDGERGMTESSIAVWEATPRAGALPAPRLRGKRAR